MAPLMCLSSPFQLRLPSLPSQLRPLPDPPPCTPLHMPLEVPSPPEPPDPPDLSSHLVLFQLFNTSLIFYQTISKSHDLKSLWLNLDFVISGDVVSLVSGSLTMGSCSHSLPPDQSFSKRVSNLFSGYMLKSLVWYFGFSRGWFLDLALMCPYTALWNPFTALCSSFTVLYSSTSMVFKSLCVQLWQLDGLMSHISTHPVDLILSDVYYSAWNASTGDCGLGWLLRNADGLVAEKSSSHRRYVLSALVAEALAVKAAITAAISSHVSSIRVYSDSKTLISLLKSQGKDVVLKGVLHDISVLARSFSSIQFMFVSCLANVEADLLAKAALLSFASTKTL